MATIIRSADIEVDAVEAWDALADFGALHDRLVRGFVVDTRLDSTDTRTVTFFNGAVVRERLVGVDPAARRLAYKLVESELAPTHHSASAQVLDFGNGRCRFVWTTDVLPDEIAPYIAEMMEAGIASIKATLETAAASGALRARSQPRFRAPSRSADGRSRCAVTPAEGRLGARSEAAEVGRGTTISATGGRSELLFAPLDGDQGSRHAGFQWLRSAMVNRTSGGRGATWVPRPSYGDLPNSPPLSAKTPRKVLVQHEASAGHGLTNACAISFSTTL
jgi:hypothetical protein